MQCIRPLKASIDNDGSVTFSTKKFIKGLEPFSIVCRKCLPCRLNLAREKAIRCIHEARHFENSLFLTLTYDEENVPETLDYSHFQTFMRDLRYDVKSNNEQKIDLKNYSKEELKEKNTISYMVSGEYGDKTKRPHWHALLFNYWPEDAKFLFSNKFGDKFFTSETLSKIWGKGHISFSEITFKSAGYVARYAAKKLTHGKDQEHNFHPIHKTSSKHAIGKRWIEKNYKHTFENGYVTLPDGGIAKIPRYYLDWCKKNKPDLYLYYYQNVLPKIIYDSTSKQRKEELDWLTQIFNRSHSKSGKNRTLHPLTVKLRILNKKFERLQKHLKL